LKVFFEIDFKRGIIGQLKKKNVKLVYKKKNRVLWVYHFLIANNLFVFIKNVGSTPNL
jgi:hypothetical protein